MRPSCGSYEAPQDGGDDAGQHPRQEDEGLSTPCPGRFWLRSSATRKPTTFLEEDDAERPDHRVAEDLLQNSGSAEDLAVGLGSRRIAGSG
jgi:hypothetical protein